MKFNMSKALAISSSFVFFLFSVIGFIGTFMSGKNNITDTAVFVVAITISGGVHTLTIKSYYNKAKAENIIKDQTKAYGQIMEIRLKYNEGMMKLKKKYEMTDEDISEIEAESPIDDFSDVVMNGINETLVNEFDKTKMDLTTDTE